MSKNKAIVEEDEDEAEEDDFDLEEDIVSLDKPQVIAGNSNAGVGHTRVANENSTTVNGPPASSLAKGEERGDPSSPDSPARQNSPDRQSSPARSGSPNKSPLSRKKTTHQKNDGGSGNAEAMEEAKKKAEEA